MERVAIALGSNLGDRRAIFASAVRVLRTRIPDLRVSPFVESEPVGVGPQPPYLNGAAVGHWAGTPHDLLAWLQSVENEHGRERPFPGAPRTLDLDLIFFGDRTLSTPELILPHPRFRDRRFVLEPLTRLAHRWRDPVTNRTVRDLLRDTPGGRTTRIALAQCAAGPRTDVNLARGEVAVRAAAAAGAWLVVFPELSFTPFFPASPSHGARPEAWSETVPGSLTRRFAALAAELGIVIVLNCYERDAGAWFDTSPVIDADGCVLGSTRMLHIAQMPGCWEQDYYDAGDHGLPVFDTAAGQIGVAICYDRHYPEVMRHLGLHGAELVVVPQAGTVGEWPDGMFEAELRVAAFQNGYYAALSNRVGQEGTQVFAGGSFVCDPSGTVVAVAGQTGEELVYADLDWDRVAGSQARRFFLRDRRTDGWESCSRSE